MILIKKRLVIIILFMLIGLSIFLYFFTQVPTETSIKESDESEQQELVDLDDETEEEELKEVIVQENPVREFFSDQIKKTTDLFFTKDLHIVTLGDSLTEGVGDEMNEGGYVGIIEANLGHDDKFDLDIQNFAKRGSRTNQLLNALEDDEVTDAIADADMVLITIGANDIMQVFKENFTKLTLEKFNEEQLQYEQRLHVIFSTIRSKNEDADIFLIGFYNPFQQYFSYIEELDFIVDSWNNVGEQVAIQYEHAGFIPIKDLFEDTTINFFAEDNFHPNHLGYRLIANRVLQYIVNEGENNVEIEATNE